VLLLPRSALPDLLAGDTYPAGAELLVQTLVPGDGVGVSALCAAGQAVRWFAHRRLREKPPSGGVSTLCESIALPPEVRDYCERLIAAVRWHGPVMFEFKWTPAGAWSLIEVNGRLWGSIQLCIDCGVDLPLAMYRLARGETVAADDRYIVGRRLRWLMGDLGYLYLVLRGRSVDPRHPSRVAAIGNFLALRPGVTAIEDWRYGDWRPFARQVAAEFGR
jgi:predicted ATP-grasp superfamily ATP-dependent carboligase